MRPVEPFATEAFPQGRDPDNTDRDAGDHDAQRHAVELAEKGRNFFFCLRVAYPDPGMLLVSLHAA